MIYNIEYRLISFATEIIRITQALPKSRAGTHIAGQIMRCGTSPAANYAEAQNAESTADFIHKMKICLKELRETYVWTQIILRSGILKEFHLSTLEEESKQLIAIFAKSIQTAQKRQK